LRSSARPPTPPAYGTRPAISALAATGGLIAAAGWLPAMALYGWVLVFLFAPLHSACTAPPSPAWLNDWVARARGFLLLLPADDFRYFHFAHHRPQTRRWIPSSPGPSRPRCRLAAQVTACRSGRRRSRPAAPRRRRADDTCRRAAARDGDRQARCICCSTAWSSPATPPARRRR
jgi:hypothetical protein